MKGLLNVIRTLISVLAGIFRGPDAQENLKQSRERHIWKTSEGDSSASQDSQNTNLTEKNHANTTASNNKTTEAAREPTTDYGHRLQGASIGTNGKRIVDINPLPCSSPLPGVCETAIESQNEQAKGQRLPTAEGAESIKSNTAQIEVSGDICADEPSANIIKVEKRPDEEYTPKGHSALSTKDSTNIESQLTLADSLVEGHMHKTIELVKLLSPEINSSDTLAYTTQDVKINANRDNKHKSPSIHELISSTEIGKSALVEESIGSKKIDQEHAAYPIPPAIAPMRSASEVVVQGSNAEGNSIAAEGATSVGRGEEGASFVSNGPGEMLDKEKPESNQHSRSNGELGLGVLVDESNYEGEFSETEIMGTENIGELKGAEATWTGDVQETTDKGVIKLNPNAEKQEKKARSKRAVRQYRPLARVPSAQGSSSIVSVDVVQQRDRALRIEIRLRLEQGGFFKCSLLPRRDPTLPEMVTINDNGNTTSLVALQDDWYQDVVRSDLGSLLRSGIQWEARPDHKSIIRWSLSGRELFVLAQHDQLSGFVSTPRLVLGERHVVLCAQSRAMEVRNRINACGCANLVEFDAGRGAPEGWVGFRDVVPRIPIKPSEDGDILDALCPDPEFEILLTGGIRIGRSNWLVGFPPKIHLRGDVNSAGAVKIDGKIAVMNSGENIFVAEHWDCLGDHQVWCAGRVVSYSLSNGHDKWEAWEAHRWSLGELGVSDPCGRPAICGVLALPPLHERSHGSNQLRGIVVPLTNSLLLGNVPGQIYSATPRRDLRTRTCTAFPGFEPIWALPDDPIGCDKRSARILLVGRLGGLTAVSAGANVLRWCSVILAASRKGLLTDPNTEEVAIAWKACRILARAIWRRSP